MKWNMGENTLNVEIDFKSKTIIFSLSPEEKRNFFIFYEQKVGWNNFVLVDKKHGGVIYFDKVIFTEKKLLRIRTITGWIGDIPADTIKKLEKATNEIQDFIPNHFFCNNKEFLGYYLRTRLF